MILPDPPHLDLSGWGRGTPLFIGIAGGSGSGKTTIAEALVEAIEGVAYIRHDDYYLHQPHLDLADRARVNYDHPSSLETSLLVSHLRSLRIGEAIRKPIYDFTVHLRSPEEVEVQPAAVVIIEGILVLAETDLRQMLDHKVFVDTEPDLRLARRLERDITERGRTTESVLIQYLNFVRPMHMEFVEPSKLHADLIIPGGFNAGAVATIIELIRGRMERMADLL